MTRFEGLRVGEELPASARIVSQEDVRAYADASGDRNPLHQDHEVARGAGFSGIIAHGMFSMAHLAACLAAWMGDDGDLRRLSAEFRAPVFMGEEIVAGGRVRALDPATRIATVDLWVTVDRNGTTEHAIRKGEAVVVFPA